MQLQIARQPAALPLSLEEARLHLKRATSAEDALITTWIAAANAVVEQETRQRLISTRLRLVLDQFPRCGQEIVLPCSPLLQVVGVQYTGPDGALYAVPDTAYVAGGIGGVGRVGCIGSAWPITRPQPGAVAVLFDAGWAAPIKVDIEAHTITAKSWPALPVGAPVSLSNSGGALPAPLTADAEFYVRTVVAPGVYTLSAEPGGDLVELQDAGTGQHYIGAVPPPAKAWMLLRLGALDANREETGAKQDALPFAAGLLDPLRVYC